MSDFEFDSFFLFLIFTCRKEKKTAD